MAWSTFVIAGYWAVEPDLSASVRIDLVCADRRRQAGTNPVIGELPPGSLRHPGWSRRRSITASIDAGMSTCPATISAPPVMAPAGVAGHDVDRFASHPEPAVRRDRPIAHPSRRLQAGTGAGRWGWPSPHPGQ